MGQSYELTTARDHAAVTLSDSTVFSPPFRALFVGTGGAGTQITVTSLAGNDAVYKNVPSGSTLEVAGTKVKATGTTAADIVALY